MLLGAVVGAAGITTQALIIDKNPPLLRVESFSLSDLTAGKHQDKLAHSLSTTGLIAIHVPAGEEDHVDFAQAREMAMAGMCECWEALEGTNSVTLQDGETRRTTLATATIGTTPLALTTSSNDASLLQAACGPDTVDALESLRDYVAAASNGFVRALDRLLLHGVAAAGSHLLLRDSYGGSYPTVQSIVKASKHLEHFHYYEKPPHTHNNQEATLKLHTDAGLFLAFVPGRSCHEPEEEESQSFFVQDEDGILRRAVFPDGAIAVMLGAGAEHWLETSMALRATRHAVHMSAGEARVWYGMSKFLRFSHFASLCLVSIASGLHVERPCNI